MGYDSFKNRFINDISRFQNATTKIPSLKRALDKAVMKELPTRDNKAIFVVRDITNSNALHLNHHSPNLMCKYSKTNKSLIVGTLSPAWSNGWRDISTDSFIIDQIDSFFHLANQYIYRGYQINIIGAIALTYGIGCDFRGSEFYKTDLSHSNAAYNKFYSEIPLTRSKKNYLFERYIDIINSFDPFINRMLYYYVRSLSLRKDDYDEEAITAADNAIDVIFQAIKKRKNLPTMDRKDMYQIVDQEIHFPYGVIDKLKDLYQLRCSFSAHPAQSKWWDFFEMYEKDIEAIMDSVKSVVVKFLMFEKRNRNIDRAPSCWSKWFLEHCETIYDAVWFHKLPTLTQEIV